MDIHELAEQALAEVPGLIEDLQGMAHDADNFSPKQRVDAARTMTGLLKILLDRTHPCLTASQQTNIHVDPVKLLAKHLPPPLVKQLKNALDRQLLQAPEKVIDVEP